MQELAFRPYHDDRDAGAVRALFHSNVPRYFALEEEPDFWRYVRSGEPYFVAEVAGTVVAAGGYADSGTHLSLCWGMVHGQWHRQGIGRAFTAWRLARCRAQYPHRPVRIETSHLTAPFYAALGFAVLKTRPHGIAPGLDLVHMERPALL